MTSWIVRSSAAAWKQPVTGMTWRWTAGRSRCVQLQRGMLDHRWSSTWLTAHQAPQSSWTAASAGNRCQPVDAGHSLDTAAPDHAGIGRLELPVETLFVRELSASEDPGVAKWHGQTFALSWSAVPPRSTQNRPTCASMKKWMLTRRWGRMRWWIKSPKLYRMLDKLWQHWVLCSSDKLLLI